MNPSAALYGRSLGFPPRVGADGRMVWSEGETNVRESMQIILQTRPGERLLLPEFGCRLEQYLFEPNTISTLRLIQEEVKQAINRWEPRVRLDDIVVEVNPQDVRVVDITIYYTLVATQVRDQLAMSVTTQA
ncbi:MAG: GPW/gp25 family protein [Anaerolineae bacterium]